jgi:tRNA G18 (ribose-2'-O)-methylase SpoU
LEPLLQARSETIDVYVAEKALLETMTGFSMYQGLLAVGRIPSPSGLDDILARSTRPWLLAAVDGLSSAENLGALVRNCAAFGVHALITSETSTSPFLRRAIRSSMGTIFQLPVIELAQRSAGRPDPQQEHAVSSGSAAGFEPAVGGDVRHSVANYATLADTFIQLQKRGIRCIAADAHQAARTPSQTDFRGDCCIVFGSEGYGISEPVLKNCDHITTIPMTPRVDSLNVGAAAAVLLYEVQRQRTT